MTLATPPTAPAAVPRAHGWRWAVGTLLVVGLILGVTLAGQRFVAARRLAAARVPDPRDPPITALALAHPAGLVADVTPFAGGRRLALLAGPPAPTCAPDVSCARPATYDRLLALDTATATTLWQAPLAGERQHPAALVVDDQRGLVDVISQGGVAVFDAATGAPRATFALPHGATTSARTAAAFSGDGAVILTADEAGAPVLLAFDALTGAARFDRALPAASASQGPVIAAADGLALVLTSIPGQTLLTGYATADGAPRASVAVPERARLGPFDAARGQLYLFGAGGTTDALALRGLLAGGSDSLAAPAAARLTTVPWLRGAVALGWNATLGHLYALDAAGGRVLDGASGKTLAALPLGASPPATTPLAVDEADGLLALPTGGGAIVLLSDASAPPTRVTSAVTAAILARAAYTRIVAQGPQLPAFLSSDDIPPAPGTLDVPFWTHSDSVGWQSGSPGSVALAASPAAHGAYDVTITIRWMQHSFAHVHTTALRVAPAGGVQLLRDGGDPLP